MTLTGQRLLGMAAAAVPIAAYVKDIEKLDCSVILLQRILSPFNKPMKNIINTAAPPLAEHNWLVAFVRLSVLLT